jgi:hypothetical protein
MTTQATSPADADERLPLDYIPEPDEVRRRLTACVREAALLRSLLRLSERVKREGRPSRREAVAHG